MIKVPYLGTGFHYDWYLLRELYRRGRRFSLFVLKRYIGSKVMSSMKHRDLGPAMYSTEGCEETTV